MIGVKVPALKVVIIGLFIPLFLKLFYLQVMRGEYFHKKALKQQEDYLVINGERGEIFDCRGRILAMDRNVYSVFINPRQVENKEKVAKEISKVLNLDVVTVLNKLNKDSYFVWIKRGLDRGPMLKKLQKLHIPGLGIRTERHRIYPQGKLAAQVLGAVDIDNNGISGIELYYNNILKSTPGYMITLEDGRNLSLSEFCKAYALPSNGKSLVLTLDQILQHYAEEQAQRLYEKYNAKRVSIIIMNPYNGDILALANRPTYDPNDVKPCDIKNMRDFAISDNFEPGSVFKVITAAALLAEGLVNFKEKVYCESGIYRIGRRILHDYHKYGWLDFRSVIVHSSNIGVAKFVQRLDKDTFYTYLRLFGIGEKTNIDLPGESSGYLRGPESWSDYSEISVAIGQEVAVTTLQLAKMMSIIANGGYEVHPHIVKEIRDENGMSIRTINGKTEKRILSPSVVKDLKSILGDVVEKGTGRYARSKIYLAGGKTGTAQKANVEKGGYWRNKYVATFAGFLPLENPQFVIVVTVDEPQPVHFGGVVCAPAFKEIAERTLMYTAMSEEKRVDYEIRKDFIWN